MSNSRFFQLLPADPAAAHVTVRYEGRPLRVPAGLTVAAALLAGGVTTFRTTPVGEAPRAPWCMMGVCFDCLLDIDGEPNQQGCQRIVRDGMDIRSQRGSAELNDE
ncbi:NAD(FAD)-dependent dehydrogenase [Burkholderia sp. WAC0059]|uniref:(2Fe-2S)-binding protein n=1 Tax=Burkholderia sp. WAC0059 TaxID=2066022 RepID=UPI000C7EB859|nr:(2Fe-2S)-binding protein [Burkholderia sp. WAC0059]PLZ02373.1 NAD(FAD)-dependent dehydrogenase [Burkholderia sp. WAC0059]